MFNTQTATSSLQDIDFLRNCFALAPRPDDSHQCILIPAHKNADNHRAFCSCCRGSYANCVHGKTLVALYAQLAEQLREQPQEAFERSAFARLFASIADLCPTAAEGLRLTDDGETLEIRSRNNQLLCSCHTRDSRRRRLLGRLGVEGAPVSRRTLMLKAARFAYSDSEKIMEARGHKTTRQVREQSFWYTFAYHCFRELSECEVRIQAFIDVAQAALRARISSVDRPRYAVCIPAKAAPGFIERARRSSCVALEFTVADEPVDLLFRLTEKGATIVIEPAVTPDRRTYVIDSRLIFGNCVYVAELNTLYPLSDSSVRLIAARWHIPREMPTSSLSGFLEKHPNIFSLDDGEVAALPGESMDLFNSAPREANYRRLTGVRFLTRFDWVEMLPRAMERNWCWISAQYGSGDTSVSLTELLRARTEGRRYLTAGTAIIDCHSPEIAAIVSGPGMKIGEKGVRISRARLFQLANRSVTVRTEGAGARIKAIRSMLALKPMRALRKLEGLNTKLRQYQKTGVEWLLFLYDNRFGGLLCDDMGLGKTHQTLGLILAVREQRGCTQPALVVCPTTVISHWARIIRTFAPGLRIGVLHGAERNAMRAVEHSDIVLTSYGIMRNDIDELCAYRFSLAVFDEAQNLKNAGTLSFQAAIRIQADAIIGLTGTPIENRLLELKALFDLVMPGYFGSAEDFIERFERPIEQRQEGAHAALRRMIEPFVLRRLKESVLDELPEKIEDSMLCELSAEQVGLYRESIQKRGTALAQTLRDGNAAIPYMHIFSLLNLLKRICDHPALIAEDCQGYRDYQSGKWDLFCELLAESLDSGRKIVVFSQYLGMIGIMDRYLTDQGIDHAVLTGSSENRGAIVERFNGKNACRVIVVSLLAGGVGIDLVGGSVVIHYDRWWNAAREDQATDRVHRIGQKRAVQVFKLVTEGTLEEKIAGIIQKKKNLGAGLITEDSPDSLKNYTREDLLGLLEGL